MVVGVVVLMVAVVGVAVQMVVVVGVVVPMVVVVWVVCTLVREKNQYLLLFFHGFFFCKFLTTIESVSISEN